MTTDERRRPDEGARRRCSRRWPRSAPSATTSSSWSSASPRARARSPRIIERLGLTDAVQFVSGVTTERIVELYAEAEVAVVPSLYEGFSLPAVEAMACGVPLVATTGGALPEVVGTDGETGLLVPPGDPDALWPPRILRVLGDAELRARIGAAGRSTRRSTGSPGGRPPTARSSTTARCSTSTRRGPAPDADRRLRPARAARRRPAARHGLRRRAARVRGDAARRDRSSRSTTTTAELKDVRATRRRDDRGRRDPARRAAAARSTATRCALPFPDATFDRIIASEVLEHIWADRGAIAELVRVLRPGGRMAVTVPTRWPERVCWALDYSYHDTPGGHVRIYRQHELEQQARGARASWLRGSHHAHALHSPYWWLKCAVGRRQHRTRWPVRKYHDFLVWQICDNPRWLAHRRPRAEPRASARASSSTPQKVGVDVTRARAARRRRHHHRGASSRETVDAIASHPARRRQHPVDPGGHTDPWNLVEAAMALDLGGRHDEARARVRVAARHAARRRRLARVLPRRRRSRTPRSTPTSPATSRPACGTTTSPPATPRTSASSGRRSRRAIDFALDYQTRDRRDRVARRRPRRRRAAHRLVEHPPEPAVRDRDRRAPRARAARLGAVARRARHRDRAPTRRVPRQGPLGDGLVLPDPRRRAARPRRARAHRRPAGRRSWSRAAACAACPTGRGSPRRRRASS